MKEVDFNRAMADLSLYGTKGHERLIVQDDMLCTKGRGNFLQRLVSYFYKPENERIQTIATFANTFFKDHENEIVDSKVLERLKPILEKRKKVDDNQLEEEIGRVQNKNTDPIKQLREIFLNEALTLSSDVMTSTIVAAQARLDLDKAYDDAKKIDDPIDRVKALEHIANLSNDRSILKEAIETANKDNTPNKSFDLTSLYHAMAKSDPKEAFEMAKQEKNLEDRAVFMAIAAVHQPNHDIGETWINAALIEGDQSGNPSYIQKRIVNIIAEDFYDKAHEIARKIEHDEIRATAFAWLSRCCNPKHSTARVGEVEVKTSEIIKEIRNSGYNESLSKYFLAPLIKAADGLVDDKPSEARKILDLCYRKVARKSEDIVIPGRLNRSGLRHEKFVRIIKVHEKLGLDVYQVFAMADRCKFDSIAKKADFFAGIAKEL